MVNSHIETFSARVASLPERDESRSSDLEAATRPSLAIWDSWGAQATSGGSPGPRHLKKRQDGRKGFEAVDIEIGDCPHNGVRSDRWPAEVAGIEDPGTGVDSILQQNARQ